MQSKSQQSKRNRNNMINILNIVVRGGGHFQKDKNIDWIKNLPRLAWIDLQQQDEGEQPKHTAKNLMANDLQVSRTVSKAPCHATS